MQRKLVVGSRELLFSRVQKLLLPAWQGFLQTPWKLSDGLQQPSPPQRAEGGGKEHWCVCAREEGLWETFLLPVRLGCMGQAMRQSGKVSRGLGSQRSREVVGREGCPGHQRPASVKVASESRNGTSLTVLVSSAGDRLAHVTWKDLSGSLDHDNQESHHHSHYSLPSGHHHLSSVGRKEP